MINNPIINPSKIKNAAVPFNEIRNEHFLPALEQAIATGQQKIAQLKSQPASFDHTFRGLEASTEQMEFVYTLFSNLLGAHGNEEMQKLALQMGPMVASFANDILLDSEVFARVKAVYDQRQQMALSPEQTRLVEKTYQDFERSGAGLSDQKKQQLRAIDERLSLLTPKFRDNVLKATNEFEMWVDKKEDLVGLPPTAIQAAREAAEEKGQSEKWLFTLQRPSYAPFMAHSQRRELREKMARAFSTRSAGGPHDNLPVLLEIADLLKQKAQLLGYRSYMDYALQTRMAETPEQVAGFLKRLTDVAKPVALKEIAEVQKMADEMGGPNPLQAWDFPYYSERLMEKKYAFDEEQLRPYLKLENVLQGVFEHARRLFGLKFVLSKDYPKYHEDVEVYEVYKDRGEKQFVGLFYADFFPRSSKQGGAWMTAYREQSGGKRFRPHVSIVCNFTKPTAEQPSLLTFDEVQTLFHEFGHALHGLLSQVEHRTLAGTNVYLDFVELPSQLLENWAEEEESLKFYALHYKTGEVMPKQLVDALKRSQRYLAAYHTIRQLNFGLLDMAWFTNPPATNGDAMAFENHATATTQLLPKVPNANISASFTHIFGGGYAAGYYSYKWAEALDADAFELFREKGIFDAASALKLEEFILSKGASDHPMRLYEQFRGRAPDPDALLRRDGLIS